MIVASLLLILVAVTLLVFGLGSGSSPLLISSIVASLLAAGALVVGARHANGVRRSPAAPELAPLAVDLDNDPGPVSAVPDNAGRTVAASGVQAAGERPAPDPPSRVSVGEPLADGASAEPASAEPASAGFTEQQPALHDGVYDDDEDPADEPAPQLISPADAVRVARLPSEVLVVDGRPRYHLGDCPHLLARITDPLPAAEAVELGFTPCSMCRPVDRLVAEAAAHR